MLFLGGATMKKKMYVSLLVGSMIFALTACGGSGSSKTTESKTEAAAENDFVWPFGEIGNMLPKLEGKQGKLSWEDSDGLSMDLYDISTKEFTEYVKKCQEAGFNVDYSMRNNTYSAYNADGYDLYLSLNESGKKMWIRVSAPEAESEEETSGSDTAETDATTASGSEAETTEAAGSDIPVETTAVPETTAAPETTVAETEKSSSSKSGIRPEFKDAMDSYEAFFDEYCEFMQKFKANPSSLELLSSYSSYLQKYSDVMSKMDELGNSDMSDEEALYYAETTLRITNKLANAAK